jgi:hypothetical protein
MIQIGTGFFVGLVALLIIEIAIVLVYAAQLRDDRSALLREIKLWKIWQLSSETVDGMPPRSMLPDCNPNMFLSGRDPRKRMNEVYEEAETEFDQMRIRAERRRKNSSHQ